MSADAVPSGARVRPSMRSSVAVADTRFVDVHGEVVLPAAWLCRVANLPNFFLRVFPPTITFLVLPPPLVHPYIVGLDICRCVDLRVGGIASVMGGMVPDVVYNECVDDRDVSPVFSNFFSAAAAVHAEAPAPAAAPAPVSDNVNDGVCECNQCGKPFKHVHSLLQHGVAVHEDDGMVNDVATPPLVCPVDDVIGPSTLQSVLCGAHGIAHRCPNSMQRWLAARGVAWRGCLTACQRFMDVCEQCIRVNPAHHSMQPTHIPVGVRCGTHFSFDLLYWKIGQKLHPVCVLTDNLSTFVGARVLQAVNGGDVQAGENRTGAQQVWRAMCEMQPRGDGDRKYLFVDNECRLAAWLRDKLEADGWALVPSIPNTHGNGIAERSNRRLRACLAKQDQFSSKELPGVLQRCADSLNDSPTRRLQWLSPNEVHGLAVEAQASLADYVQNVKVLSRQQRRRRRHRARHALPTVPTPYVVKTHGTAHAKYEGPFIGVPCSVHGVNCRRVWRAGWSHVSAVFLKVYKGTAVAPVPPPPADDGQPCGVHLERCGRSGMVIGKCKWCKGCHFESVNHCTVYPHHNRADDAGEWLERRAIDAVFGTIQPLDPVDVNWEVDHVAPRYIKLLDVRLDAPASVVAPLQAVPGIDVLPPSLSAGFRGEVDALVARFSHIFKMDSSPMDVAPVVLECLCPAPSLPGLFRTGYKQTPLELTFLDGEVQDWLDLEMVYSCGMPSLVCSPLFVVNPPNHRMRAVIDFSKVNGLLLPLQFPMPQWYDLLRGLEHARIFSLIDLKSGYHQVPVHPDSQWLLTFGYGGKMLQSRRLLEGISVAPAIFQSLMVGIFHLPDHCASLRASSKIWLDDFLLYSMDERSHLRLLEVFFLQCEARNVKLSLPKCVFGVTLIDWLGHVLCNGCLTPPKNYMDALLLKPRPTNVEELQSYLGSVNWILLHLPDAPRTMAPMYALLKDVPAKGKNKKKPPKAELVWNEAALRSFDSVKRMLVQPRTLKVPDLSAPFEIVCDASAVGWGAV